jgi:hypothetical protein
MTVPETAAGGSRALAGRSPPMGNDPADHDAREDEEADGDGETEPEGEAGKSGHEGKAISCQPSAVGCRPDPLPGSRERKADSRELQYNPGP